MKKDKMVYWASTGLLSAMMVASPLMYIFKHQMVSETFARLGYPTSLVYPLAIAKLLGVVAILTRRSKLLTEWAYAGFFFCFVLAALAHLEVGDGEAAPAIAALVLSTLSRWSATRVFERKDQS